MTGAFSTARGFVLYVEGQLGWAPLSKGMIRPRALNLEIGRVTSMIERDPGLYTWANLQLAADWCRKRHLTQRPTQVVSRVEVAVREDGVPVEIHSDVAEAIQAAIAVEQKHSLPGWQDWVRQLTRAQGWGRNELYAQWECERIVRDVR